MKRIAQFINKHYRRLLVTALLITVVLSALHLLKSDIFFHTDIARDFLLVEDIVDNRNITLLGPRSGGISGVFHGPLWLYLQIPAFITGGGNPGIVGWFWLLLCVFSIYIMYLIGSRLFSKTVGLLAALLFSSLTILYTKSLFNPFGAVLLSPIFYYLFLQYLSSARFLHLILSLFVLGIIIQFQMAWGGPILLLTFIYLLYRKVKLYHFAAFLILLVPLSTFIVFELKHDFLQLNAIISYIHQKSGPGLLKLSDLFLTRLKGSFVDGFGFLPSTNIILNLCVNFFFLGSIVYLFRKKKLKYKAFFSLFFYYYSGFWLMGLMYKGVMWGYYYWPFFPIAILLFSSLYHHLPKKIFISIFLFIYLFNVSVGLREALKFYNESGKSGATWQFYSSVAQQVYKDGNKEFGYYIFTPDQLGYSFRYGMNYWQKKFKDKKAYPFEKKEYTYLLIAPPPGDKPYLNGDWWTENQVKIKKKPESVVRTGDGFKIEKYHLSPEEIAVGSDPNLIDSLHFR